MKNTNRLIITLVSVSIIAAIIFEISKYNNREIVTTKVVGKERITDFNSNNGTISYYLVFTEAGTFKLEDDIVYGNFRSSDWYGDIKSDKVYEFEVIGWRIGYISEYPNIVNYKQLNIQKAELSK
jgi:hypothetical protein